MVKKKDIPSLDFFYNLIRQFKQDPSNWLKEYQHQASLEHPLPKPLQQAIWDETLNFIDYLKAETLNFSQEEDMLFFLNRIETYIQSLFNTIIKMDFPESKILTDALTLLQNRIKYNLENYETSKKQHSNSLFLLRELQALKTFLDGNTIYSELIEASCNRSILVGRSPAVSDKFITDQILFYEKIALARKQNIEKEIRHHSLKLKKETFVNFLQINHNLLQELNHPEINNNLKSLLNSQVQYDPLYLAEMQIRSLIQNVLTTPILQFIEENYSSYLIPLKENSSSQEILKLRSPLNRIQVTLLSLLICDSKILLNFETDSQLASILEKHLLYETDKPMKNIRTLIAQIRSNEKNILPAFEKILSILEENIKKITK
ncbi:MAG: hypothetical protein ACEPOZ_16645 [Marinifilaceae bacterium]